MVVLEEISRFHISDGVWDIIPDLSSDVRKSFSLRVLTMALVSRDRAFYEFHILRSYFSSQTFP